MSLHLPAECRAERILRTLNDCVRTLLFHSNVPHRFWPDALATATLLVNIRPYRPRWNYTLHHILFGSPPSCDGLRIFGCVCYPSTASTTPHKLAPRSTACVFLGYPASHHGYWCLDLTTRRIIISRHVVFDEHTFPFATTRTAQSPDYLDFLLDLVATQPAPTVVTAASPSPSPSPPPPPPPSRLSR